MQQDICQKQQLPNPVKVKLWSLPTLQPSLYLSRWPDTWWQSLWWWWDVELSRLSVEWLPGTMKWSPVLCNTVQIKFLLNTFIAPLYLSILYSRQPGGILTCNLNITISSNHIWISARQIEPVDTYTWDKQSVTLSSSDHIKHFIFSALALISLVTPVLCLTFGGDICLILYLIFKYFSD